MSRTTVQAINTSFVEEVYAVVDTATGDILWAGLADPDEARDRAVRACFQTMGMVSLLSGADLGRFLINKTDE